MGLNPPGPHRAPGSRQLRSASQTSGMTDVPDKALEHLRGWTLSRDSLQRLLNWLDGGANSDGYAYVEIRRRLRDYFARKNCRAADDLADETLTRVARRLEEEGITLTETPARYCYIVARFVFLEHLRGPTPIGCRSPVDRRRAAAARLVCSGRRGSWHTGKAPRQPREVSPGPRSAESPHHHAVLHRKRAREDRQPPRAGRKPRPQRECPGDSRIPDSQTP